MNNNHIKIVLPEDDLETLNKIKLFLEHTLNFNVSQNSENDCEILTLYRKANLCEYKNKELTSREIEILTLMTKGLKNKTIAKALFLSEKTVKNNITDIFKKLDVDNRTNAVLYAFKNNLK